VLHPLASGFFSKKRKNTAPKPLQTIHQKLHSKKLTMRGTLKLFTWLRIPVFVHWTFGLLLPLAVWGAWDGGLSWFNLGLQLGVLAVMFTCVLLHEYGHSLAARRYGVQTQDIILTPIGGIARLERMPEKPMQELVVAIAGPMVNVAIVVGCLLLCRFVFFDDEVKWFFLESNLREWIPFAGEEDSGMSEIMEETGIQPTFGMISMIALLLINLMMIFFNLIPAFPMDGGRVLRALLAMRLGRTRATQIAAWVGQAIAVIFVGYGLYTDQFMLSLIGVFVFTNARTENSMVQLEAILRRHVAGDVMQPFDFEQQLRTTDWMQSATAARQQGRQRSFLVFDLEDQLVGTLLDKDIVAAEKRRDTSAPVSAYARAGVEIVHATESLRYVYYLLRYQQVGIVAVTDHDEQLVGVIDEVGLGRFLKSA
jgi:Zn-dependent protease